MPGQTSHEDLEMSFLCLLPMLVAISGISLQDIIVSQPEYTTVTAGDAATLQCSFNSSEKVSIGGYKWFFINPSSSSMTEVTNSSEKFSGRIFMPDHTIFTSQKKANIDIHDVQRNDAGTYVCEVELFRNNSKGRGNRTKLLVLEGIFLQDITVSQPRNTNVRAGEAATLQCSYNSREKSSIGGYKWFFIKPSSSSMTEVTNNSERFSGRVFFLKDTIFTSQQKADIEIQDVQPNDTGTYVCEVELFMIKRKGRGNGTQLLVLEAPQTPGSRFPSYRMGLGIGVGVACLILASALRIIRLRNRKRESCPDSSNDVVYAASTRQGKKGEHGQATTLLQECLLYATLSTEDDKRGPQPCKASEQVVYSRAQADVQLGVSRRPSQDPEYILYTMVNTITGAKAADCPRDKLESVYATTSLNA